MEVRSTISSRRATLALATSPQEKILARNWGSLPEIEVSRRESEWPMVRAAAYAAGIAFFGAVAFVQLVF